MGGGGGVVLGMAAAIAEHDAQAEWDGGCHIDWQVRSPAPRRPGSGEVIGAPPCIFP
jgi:hypothetical protein